MEQREGFDMFGQMMHGIWQDAIRYLMHVEIEVRQQAPVDGGGRRTWWTPRCGRTPRRTPPSATCSTPRPTSRPPPAERPAWRPPPEPRPRRRHRRQRGQRGQAGPTATATTTARTNTPVVKSAGTRPAQRPVPVRLGPKFKACHGASPPAPMRDLSDELKALRARLDEAEGYRVDELRARRPQLEAEAPPTWWTTRSGPGG